jgi:hypothetical protein
VDSAEETDSGPGDTAGDGDGGDVREEIDVSEGPRACGDHEACDELPDEAGVCHGTCRSTDDVLRCDDGEVVDAVCRRLSSRSQPTQEVDFGDFTVTPIAWPEDAYVGESYDFELRLKNDTDRELTLTFTWKHPDTFDLSDVSWEDTDGFRLGAGASARLTATITAMQPTLLSFDGGIIASFRFGEVVYEPRSVVHFPDSEPISCGGEFFPDSWCPSDGCYESRNFYFSARCCDDVFFPGAQCCNDQDCIGGACVDGRCVWSVPQFGSANNAAIGHQTVRIVLVDTHLQFEDPCADHFADVQDEIDFATAEAWYDDLAMRRIGRDAVDFRWIVQGGVATEDFLTGPNQWADYSRELDAWFSARGCPLFGTSDKLVVVSGTVDMMGFGGFYFSDGHIAKGAINNAYLLAHELGHSFGANDLYLDLGGVFLYPHDLMGNSLSGPPHPGDRVAWSEMGFGDIDRNGIVDVVELAAFPEELLVLDAEAVITGRRTIEISWEFGAREGDEIKQVLIPHYAIDVPAAEAHIEQSGAGRRKLIVLDETQLDLDAVAAAGEIEVIVSGKLSFTDRDWSYRTLVLEETLPVPITVP